jgi:hypothetical protein
MYPYNLAFNPFPSAPTPSESDTLLLGGRRHKQAKLAIISCIEDLLKKVHEDHGSRQFRLVTVVHDVGSGKTHLALHLRSCGELLDKAIVSFSDLSQLYPRTSKGIYQGMIGGVDKYYINELRYAILYYLRQRAEADDDKKARKIFRYTMWDKMKSTSLDKKMQLILDNKISCDEIALKEVLADHFSAAEIYMIQSILGDRFLPNHTETISLEETIINLSALAKINLTFLHKISVFEIDEFDSDGHSMDILKALINAHLPSTLLLLVLTPSAYEQIRNINLPLYDRLEKANYKIDLAGSNTLDEISGIILEYIDAGQKDGSMSISERDDLLSKIKILYDEFPDFRNIRSMINVMYHSIEYSEKNCSGKIDEQVLDQTIATVYPGLRLRDNIMDVPVSEFMKIALESKNNEMIKDRVGQAVNALINCTSDNGKVVGTSFPRDNGKSVDVAFVDFGGKKTEVEVSIDRSDATSSESKPNTDISKIAVRDRATFSDEKSMENIQHFSYVTIDRHRLIDLLYFSNKYYSNEIGQDDIEKAIVLGKSIKLY